MSWDDSSRPPPPRCPGCGAEMKCLGCDDIRPRAEDLGRGWLLRSPLDRVETVTRVERDASYGPLRVWTAETGDHPWLYWHAAKVDAVRPLQRLRGEPEIRIVEHSGRDGPMYAVATSSTVHSPVRDSAAALVEAVYSKSTGWTVAHRPDGGDVVTVACESKAKARTALMAAARQHAKALKIPVRKQNAR
jgi:hypothetical protein